MAKICKHCKEEFDTQSPIITECLINHHMEKINKATAEGLAISLNDKKLLQ